MNLKMSCWRSLRVTGKSGVERGGARVGVGGECAHKRVPIMLFLCKNVRRT